MSVKLEGWKEFSEWVSSIGDEVQEVVEQEILKGGYEIERTAKMNTPVDTGRLRASINTNPKGKGSIYQVEIGTDVEYAEHVEFGTFKQSAQPFLMPAFNKVASSFQKDLSAIVNRELD